jgi:hypothetical protein
MVMKFIPWCRTNRYKCFWNGKLSLLKINEIYIKIKLKSQNFRSMRKWRMLRTKKENYHHTQMKYLDQFITKTDYKEDGL